MADYETIKRSPASSGGSSGRTAGELASAFFDGDQAEGVIDEANENETFHTLFANTNSMGATFSAEHATLAAALAVEADRKLIYRCHLWMTYGWRHPDVRTAFLETYDPGGPQMNQFVNVDQQNSKYMTGYSRDGLKFWHAQGANSSTVEVYDVGTAFDHTTIDNSSKIGAAVTSYSHPSRTSTYQRIDFSPDGTRMYTSDASGIWESTLSTAWDPTTSDTAVNEIQDGGVDVVGTNIQLWCFNDDGTEIFYFADTPDATSLHSVFKAELSTAYDLSTVSQADTTPYLMGLVSLSTQQYMGWFNSGKCLFIAQNTYFTFSTAYDLSTCTGRQRLFPTQIYLSDQPRDTRADYNIIWDHSNYLSVWSTSYRWHANFNISDWDEWFEKGASGSSYRNSYTNIAPLFSLGQLPEPKLADGAGYEQVSGGASWSNDGRYWVGCLSSVLKVGKTRVPFCQSEEHAEWLEELSSIGTAWGIPSISGPTMHPDGRGWSGLYSSASTFASFRIPEGMTLDDFARGTGIELDHAMSLNSATISASGLNTTNATYRQHCWSNDGEHLAICYHNASNADVYFLYYKADAPFMIYSGNAGNWDGTPTQVKSLNYYTKWVTDIPAHDEGPTFSANSNVFHMQYARDGSYIDLWTNSGIYRWQLSTDYDVTTMDYPDGYADEADHLSLLVGQVSPWNSANTTLRPTPHERFLFGGANMYSGSWTNL